MPVEIQLLGKLLHVRFIGTVTQAELAEGNRQTEELEARLPTTPDRIAFIAESSGSRIDFAGAQIDFSKVYELAKWRSKAKLKNTVKTAIVATNELQHGIARIFQALNTNPQITIQIYRDSESAMAWLETGHAASSETAKKE